MQCRIEYPNFKQTQQVIIQDILTSDDLDQLSYIYDDCFLVPMRARFEIDYSSPQENVKSESSAYNINAFEIQVKERDADQCVLTGTASPSFGHQVAYIIPQTLFYERIDSDGQKATKSHIRDFILRFCPWLPPDFFENLNVCENAILLSHDSHRFFGSFDWFVVMETGSDGNVIYKAMQVEENGLLGNRFLGRFVDEGEAIAGIGSYYRIDSSYNQPLFIGNTHPQPGEMYVRLHEMLARIFHMRGYAAYYEIDSDDEFDLVDHSEILTKTFNLRRGERLS
jgi:hypothetical protein